MMQPVRFRNSRGATLAEIAIGMPVFLAMIFFVMWLIEVDNARFSLSFATTNGVRLAASRAFTVLDESWVPLIAPDRETSLLRVNLPEEITNNEVRSHYTASLSRAFGEQIGDLDHVHPLYRYALIYTTQSLAQSMGSSISMPCSDKPGCVDCQFLNPLNWSTTAPRNYGAGFPLYAIGLECTYQFLPTLLRPLTALLGSVTGQESPLPTMSITRRAVFYVPDAKFMECANDFDNCTYERTNAEG